MSSKSGTRDTTSGPVPPNTGEDGDSNGDAG